MTYTKTTWSGTVPISAKNLNHLETQYDEYVDDVGSHTHDSTHYTKTESDDRFFHADNMGVGSGFDADMLDGVHVSEILTTLLPLGSIMIWSGADTTVPTGWAICTGQVVGGYTTPDLRDRFVLGAGGGYGPNVSGGSTTFTPTASLTVADHALTTAEIPSHSHSYTEIGVLQNRDGRAYENYLAGTATSTTRTAENQSSGDSAHGHTGSTVTFSAVDSRPPYYSLYFIMKYA